MSSESCPKTCGQLSTAAILISIGIVQLLAGIILLKVDYICLLAGTDFVAAASNVFVGSMLGISASVWEKKKKATSTKKSSRQNVLAGLYIAALALNATTAIIMIMGDGNKLLTEPEVSEDATSGSLIFEVLACAYVTSVCSPIVCLVIALICLSGNRIQVQDGMKQAHSITKSESYGWVYDKNVGVRPKNLDELLRQFSADKQSPVSDDNVFLENRSAVGKKGKKAKPNSNSVSSVREVLTPLEIWAQKRKKILQEITTPKPMFFSDDYLKFPDFKYGSYAETMIPRVRKSSIRQMDQNSASTPLSEENYVSNMHKAGKTMSCNPALVNLDELNVKLAARRMSYPDYLSNMNTAGTDSPVDNTMEANSTSKEAIPYESKIQNRYSIEGGNNLESPQLRNSLNTSTRMNENLTSGAQPVNKVESGYDEMDSFSNEYISKQESLVSEYSQKMTRKDSTRSVSGLTSETICELKAKINRLSMNNRSNSEHKREFMESFKSGNTRKSNLSESDIDSTHRVINSISSEGGQNNSTSWAGDVVPISIQTPENRSNISFKDVENFTSPSEDSINISMPNNADKFQAPTSEDALFERATPPFRSLKEKQTRNSPFESSKCSSVKYSERKFDFTRSPTMGSIAESPSEEDIQRHQHNLIQPLDSVAIDQIREIPKAGNEKSLHITQKRSSKASPNISPKSLLNRLWSIKRSENKELSTLIMDTDSLVGLSDEELLDRTRRMRLIRKSVILRSKEENRGETDNQENGSA